MKQFLSYLLLLDGFQRLLLVTVRELLVALRYNNKDQNNINVKNMIQNMNPKCKS